MSFQGHILCRTCRQKLSLGKLLRDEDGTHLGFAHGKFDDVELGRVTLSFIALHIQHDLVCLGDDRLYEMEDLPSYDMLVRMPPDSPRAQTTAPTILGGIALWPLPCESDEDRVRRKEASNGG
jgi:hypothetical protein